MRDEEEIHIHAPIPAPEETRPPAHKPKGRFQPGQSGNPAGRPRNPKNAAEVRDMAREKTGAMIEFLNRTALNPKVPITARVQCAIEILNRGYGRPNQSMDINHGVQSDLAQLLEEIDGKNKIRTIEGTVIRPALEVKQPLLHNRQDGQPGEVYPELGTRKPDE